MPQPRLLLVLVLLLSPAAATVSGTPHGADATDYTVTPDDRTPGATMVGYEHHAVLNDTFGVGYAQLEAVRYVVLEWTDGSFERCGGTTASLQRTFGIDRNGDANGTTTDVDLQTDSTTFERDRAVFEVAGNVSYFQRDELVLAEGGCYDNPDSAGWYQVSLHVNGSSFTTDDRISFTDRSHYFYVCDCANESAARAQLGPPPSGQSTPTPTVTPTATPTTAATPAPTPTATATATTPTATRARTPTPTATETATVSDTPTRSATRTRTPTASSTAPPSPTARPDTTVTDTTTAPPSPTTTATPTSTDPGETTPVAGTPASGPGFGVVGILVAVSVFVWWRE